ncbi:hypothetical protein MKX03_019051 [Papaver bracteatum]|nr:hypothetical protein MKX03_019051 [Papaver bracteatum]
MASSSSFSGGSSISSAYHHHHHERRPYMKPKFIQSRPISNQNDPYSSLTSITTTCTAVDNNNSNNLTEKNGNSIRNVRGERDRDREKERESRERKEEVNNKIASKKAISVILRREATKAIIEKKKGPTNSKKLLPRTLLEALHERISALRWESALKVFELLQEQLWYRPNPGIYIKLIVMLGKCKHPEKAQELFQSMIDEGCMATHESYTALVSAYSRTGLLDQAFSLLEQMKVTPGWCQAQYHHIQHPHRCLWESRQMESTLMEMLLEQECQPDVWTMNSTLRAFGGSGQIETMERCYEKFQSAGIRPSIKTFNILLDSYGKAGSYEKMSAVMEYMQKYYFSWTIVTYNVVIDAFGRAGDLKQMEYLFRLMRSERIKPNCVTLCSLVRSYGRAGAKEKIEGVLRFIENSDILLDTVFFNCLVDAYGRLGCLAEMRQVLEMMEKSCCKPDKVTYSTMIKAYTSNGVSSRAKELQDIVGKQYVNRRDSELSQIEEPHFH